MKEIISDKRLKVYPRIIAMVFIIVFLTNNLSRECWRGGIGGYISYDFLTYYAIGKIFWSEAANLDDPETSMKEDQQA